MTYAYNDVGNLTSVTDPTGTTTFTYFDNHLLKKITYPTGLFLEYSYDTLGRRTSMIDQDGRWEYGYDKTGQLISAIFTSTNPDIPDRSVAYSYDAAGNRTEIVTDGSTETYTTNSLNQYDQAGDTHFTYDADGNLVTRTTSAGTTTFTYNDDNRLTSVSGPDGLTQYQYDGLGNLTSIVKNGTTTYYLIDPAGYGNVVGEYDDTGSLITGYTHGMGLVAKDNHYFTFDGSGNTSELTDEGIEAVNTYIYDPFGKVFHSTGTAENEFQFVGQFGIRQDGDDLVYMRNRFYMPSTGRFMNPDPIGMAGGINLYGYVLNDPVNLVDPDGLEPITTTAIILAAPLIADFASGFLMPGMPPLTPAGTLGISSRYALNQFLDVDAIMLKGADTMLNLLNATWDEFIRQMDNDPFLNPQNFRSPIKEEYYWEAPSACK